MLRFVWFLLLTLSVGVRANEPIKLVIPDFKPYTYIANGQAKGVGIDAVVPILNKMGKPYAIELVPNYGRALAEIKAQRTDGFFLASESAERNQVAEFSHPLVVNHWSWFKLESQDSDLTDDLKVRTRIGTIINTNTHKWLLANNYEVSFVTHDPKKLVSNLQHKRLDAVFLAEAVFLDALESMGEQAPKVEKRVEVKRPFGVYFSKKFLANNQGFLSEFNRLVREQ